MKEYRLTAWPDLDPTHDRTRFRRLLSDMSHRYMSVAQLSARSGLRRPVVREFVERLAARGVAVEREGHAPDSLFGSLRPLGGLARPHVRGRNRAALKRDARRGLSAFPSRG